MAVLDKLKVGQQFENKETCNQTHSDQPTAQPRIRFRTINSLELEEVLKKIQILKASGILKISSSKFHFKKLVPQLLYMLNLVIMSNTIPLSWKRAVVTPTLKAGSPGTPNNN